MKALLGWLTVLLEYINLLTNICGQICKKGSYISNTVGLGGNAILVLDILYRKNRGITIYLGFYSSLWIDCSIRIF